MREALPNSTPMPAQEFFDDFRANVFADSNFLTKAARMAGFARRDRRACRVDVCSFARLADQQA
jgi:hypothetical protein